MSSTRRRWRAPGGWAMACLGGLALAAPSGWAGANDSDAARLCRSVPCRPARKIKLRVDEQHLYQGKAPRTPYVHEGAVQLLPGETLFIAVDIDGDRLVNLRRVKQPAKRGRTLELRLEQPGKARADTGMMLTIGNPFKRALRYKAAFLPVSAAGAAAEEPRPLSTCPVAPRMKSHESWPHPILRLYLRDFLLVDSEGPCG